MNFPLPTGICRKVCRPTRVPARVVRAKDVKRFAKAALANGENACLILGGVYSELDERLGYTRRMLDEVGELNDAIQEVNSEIVKVLRELIMIRFRPWRIVKLVRAIYDLVSALNVMAEKQTKLMQTVLVVAGCLESLP